MVISPTISSVAASESLRLPSVERSQAGKSLPLKMTGPAAAIGSCASYGRGFYRVESTGTCVKIGGSTSLDTTIRR